MEKQLKSTAMWAGVAVAITAMMCVWGQAAFAQDSGRAENTFSQTSVANVKNAVLGSNVPKTWESARPI